MSPSRIVAINIPPIREDMSERQWVAHGLKLAQAAEGVNWAIGEWWLYGERAFGKSTAIVNAPDWQGPSLETCKKAALCCKRFPTENRRPVVPFSHHREVVNLPTERANAILDRIEQRHAETGQLPAVKEIRQEVKRETRARKEADLSIAAAEASVKLGKQLFGVIYADPPWRFEPYSRTSGMDRAADNHYPTLNVDEICALEVPAAANCALFLWATAPMLPAALRVMAAWNFSYRSHWIWVKDRAGTGYWNRNAHELLLLGVRGSVPAPSPGDQYESVVEAAVTAHSAKPHDFREMIEEMFPTSELLEMFGRGVPPEGWTFWGNEAVAVPDRPEQETAA